MMLWQFLSDAPAVWALTILASWSSAVSRVFENFIPESWRAAAVFVIIIKVPIRHVFAGFQIKALKL